MIATVDRVKQLSRTDIKQCIRNSTPMIATAMLDSWKAATSWSFDFFKQRYGSDVVTLSDGRFRPLAQLPLAKCIDVILTLDLGDTYKHGGATPYIQDWVVLDIHPELYQDVEVPEWFDNWERPFRKVFRPGGRYHDIVALAGPAGATTFIHRDRRGTHAWLAQVVGRKKWTMFPPDQLPLVHNKNFAPGASPFVNISDPDLDSFPRFREATPIEFILHPGELLFVPSGWLHQVTSLDPTISVSGNFVNGSNIGAFVTDAYHEFWDNLKQRRRSLPPPLVKSLAMIAQRIERGKLVASSSAAMISGKWRGCELRLTAKPDGMSWTLSNYTHGRRYTSFFADRRTDFDAVGLSRSGQAATRELLSLSPRRELRVIVGLTTASVSLYGQFDNVTDHNERVLAAMQALTESLRASAEVAVEMGA